MDDIEDGLSHTMIIGECIFYYGTDSSGGVHENDHWAIGSAEIDARLDLTEFLGSTKLGFNTNNEMSFGSWHGNITNVAFADGSVATIDNEIDSNVRLYIGNRKDQQTIEADAF